MTVLNAQKFIDNNSEITCPHCGSEQVQMGGVSMALVDGTQNINVDFVCTMCELDFKFNLKEGSNNSVRAQIILE